MTDETEGLTDLVAAMARHAVAGTFDQKQDAAGDIRRLLHARSNLSRTPSPDTEGLVERVARLICELNFARKGAEGEHGSVDDCWWAFVDDARSFLGQPNDAQPQSGDSNE